MENQKKDIHDRPGYADPSPYPEIKVEGPNRYYAQLISDDYCGKISEFSAISQYLYHNFSIRPEYKELAEIIENISIVEMHHMEMLATIIRLLGFEPIFTNGSNVFWNANYVYYGKNVCDKLKGDLKSELDAISTYEMHIDIIKDPYIQAVLRRIVLDEKVHVKIFEEQIKKYCLNKIP
jgi:bacterioferritin